MKKVSVISGGSGGLGLALAECLIRSGKNVLIIGRDPQKLSRAGKRLTRISKHSHTDTLVCNIGIEEEVNKLGQFLKEHKTVVENLFNNAGRGLAEDIKSSTSQKINDVFEANLKGMILLTSEILRITPEKEDLTIVNIMSTSALTGRKNETIYCAAKWGARGFTEALREELKGTNRQVIAVYPGGMKTDFYKLADKSRDITGFMDPKDVATKIINAVLNSEKLTVSDITIRRKG